VIAGLECLSLVVTARRDLETLPGAKSDRAVVTGDGDFAAQDKRFGVEVMAMIVGKPTGW